MRIKAPETSRLWEMLDYNPTTGLFLWRVSFRRGPAKKGGIAGYCDENGYITIRIDGVTYYAHRLAWQYVFAVPPNQEMDHINRNTSDNRISNLRLCNASENAANRKRSVRNTSGYKGVCWDKSMKKWKAAITINNRKRHLGYFDTPQSAHEAYIEAARSSFKSFARFG